ncbi:hypothetical protein [Xanthobacter sp. YC-JY1]|uniref:hypothetical protein n=1 Tax=Xanthobacter sp. YC-JY1 TaxID=2419844 RepID=UPI001F2FE675|nr:hypothetical protein [Xanthobacter sp. YC-JY1]UJX47454.1 hypothetical protein D7006_24035 [Xanthobacter sp. YC-JY1]
MTRPDRRRPAGRSSLRLASALLAAGLLAGAPVAARADAAGDYIAAHTKAEAEVAAAVKAGKSDGDIEKLSTPLLKDLEKRMVGLLGPLAFKGTQKKPVFMPSSLNPDYLESKEPDGLLFSGVDLTTRYFVSPEPIFTQWLAARAKEEDAAPELRLGLKGAMGTEPFYFAVLGTDAAFIKYMDLPVTAGEGESVTAALGLFTQSGQQNDPPSSIVFTRIGDGRVVVGTADLKANIKPLPACEKLWKEANAKATKLEDAAAKTKNDEDPRWKEAETIREAGGDAFRACFVKAAPGLPFFPGAVKRAEELVQAARGK